MKEENALTRNLRYQMSDVRCQRAMQRSVIRNPAYVEASVSV